MEYKEGKILDRLSGARVLKVGTDIDQPDKVLFAENCDDCFGLWITKSELYLLIAELSHIASELK